MICTILFYQIYDCPESDMKLNEIFEFVGVFTFDPEFKVENNDEEFANGFSEDVLVQLPPNKVCLHNIYIFLTL